MGKQILVVDRQASPWRVFWGLVITVVLLAWIITSPVEAASVVRGVWVFLHTLFD